MLTVIEAYARLQSLRQQEMVIIEALAAIGDTAVRAKFGDAVDAVETLIADRVQKTIAVEISSLEKMEVRNVRSKSKSRKATEGETNVIKPARKRRAKSAE